MLRTPELILPSGIDIKVATSAIATLLRLDINARFIYRQDPLRVSGRVPNGVRLMAYEGGSIIGHDKENNPIVFGPPSFQIDNYDRLNRGFTIRLSRQKEKRLTIEKIMEEYENIKSALSD